MPTIDLLGGKVQIYQRDNIRFWQARASVGGKQHSSAPSRRARSWLPEPPRTGTNPVRGSFGPVFKQADANVPGNVFPFPGTGRVRRSRAGSVPR